MQEKTAYIRPKVVVSFPGPYASGSYVHQAALFFSLLSVCLTFSNTCKWP
jgi:hypothetical protein